MRNETFKRIIGVAGLGLLPWLSMAQPLEAPQVDVPVKKKKATDPFVKRDKKKEGAPVRNSGHLLNVFEVYRLPQGLMDRLQREMRMPGCYEQVRKLHQEGVVMLECLIALPLPSGQTALSESVDEVRYPTEFEVADDDKSKLRPKTFEMKPVGNRLMVDPVLGPDNMVDLNLDGEFSRLDGFLQFKAEGGAHGVSLPVFKSSQLKTSATTRVGEVVSFWGMNSRDDAARTNEEKEMMVSWLFWRPYFVTTVDDGKDQVFDREGRPINLKMVFRVYSLPRVVGRDLLASTWKGEELMGKMNELENAKLDAEVRLEKMMSTITRSGQRIAMNEAEERQFDVGNKEGVNLTKGLNRRKSGWEIELDPVLSDDTKVVSLNISAEFAEYCGVLKGDVLFDTCPEQPVFGCQKIITSLVAKVGRPCFLGTMNEPPATGVNARRDRGRVRFAFIEVTLE